MKTLQILLCFIILCWAWYTVGLIVATDDDVGNLQNLPTRDQIKAWQVELKEMGFYKGPIDSEWGRGMNKAMKEYWNQQSCYESLEKMQGAEQ